MKRDLEKILSYTEKNGECLEWTRALNTDGYPRALVEGNSNAKVHRVVWEIFNNQSAKGLVVRHTCDNPVCICPQHLVIGTPADNMRDRTARNRHGARKLSHYDVLQIRDLYASGLFLQRELGEMYGVNCRTVSSLVNFTHWNFPVGG